MATGTQPGPGAAVERTALGVVVGVGKFGSLRKPLAVLQKETAPQQPGPMTFPLLSSLQGPTAGSTVALESGT